MPVDPESSTQRDTNAGDDFHKLSLYEVLGVKEEASVEDIKVRLDLVIWDLWRGWVIEMLSASV